MKAMLKPLLIAALLTGCNTIAYKAEPKGEDYIQTPYETMQLGTGDCEDMAVIKYLEAVESGKEAYLVWMTLKANPFNEQDHMVTWIDGSYYGMRGKEDVSQYKEVYRMDMNNVYGRITMPLKWRTFWRRYHIEQYSLSSR